MASPVFGRPVWKSRIECDKPGELLNSLSQVKGSKVKNRRQLLHLRVRERLAREGPHVRSLFFVSVTIVGLSAPLLAGPQELGRRLGGGNGPPVADPAPDRPVPKLSDGTVDLSGVWRDGGNARLPSQLKPGELDSLMLPWAKEKMASRDPTANPYFYCLPGGPLRLTGGFAWRFVQHPTVNATHNLSDPGRQLAFLSPDLHGWAPAP